MESLYTVLKKETPYSTYYTPYQLILPLDLSIIISSDDLVCTFDRVMRGVNLKKYLVSNSDKDPRGRIGYNLVTMLKVVLFGFSLKGYVSTRELANLCVNDIRFRWLLRDEYIKHSKAPSHMTICNFINNYIKNSIEDIFKEINDFIKKEDKVDLNHTYIDGTKLEANANKYTWVWKKACITNRNKLFNKITDYLSVVNDELALFSIKIDPREEYAIEYIEDCIKTIVQYFNIDVNQFKNSKGSKKQSSQKHYEFFNYALNKLKEYSSKIEICGEERNSYSKTDKDATFMRVKRDYMGNDSLLPAYNIQFAVCDEYIMAYDVNKYASDQDCFVPLMEKFNKFNGLYPEYPVADAGYGSMNNYLYCESKNMRKYMKFTMYDKETKDKKYHNDIFRAVNFKINKNGNPVCPKNREFLKISTRAIRGNKYGRTEELYQCKNCSRCPLKKKCHKSKGNRIIRLNKELSKFHKEVIDNLQSIHGVLLMRNRAIQSEGTFGIIKYNRDYDRIVRKGLDSVNLEIGLVSIGFNIRKLHDKKIKSS